MEKKQILLTCLFTLFSVIGSQAQNKIVYAYDNAGNRTERTITLTGVQTKSAKADTIPQYFKEELGKQVIKIYPNPTAGQLSVEIMNISDSDIISGKLNLYDMTGQLLDKKEINSEKRIEFDLSNNAAGIYILKIQLGNDESSWKIVKK
jgi:hypothetical protein